MVVSDYSPGPMEVFGRRIKLEYLGMTSVYVLIALGVFRGVSWPETIAVALGAQFFFLGLKKKTRDHISGSLVLIAATALVRPAVVGESWAVPFFLCGIAVYALEGYLETRPTLIFLLPVLVLAWSWVDSSWLLGLVFVGLYLTHPWREKPGLRRRLAGVFALCATLPWLGAVARAGSVSGAVDALDAIPAGLELAVDWRWTTLVVAAVFCLAFYWRRLPWPRRLSAPVLAVPGLFDTRAVAVLAIAVAVLLAATVFRNSIDSDRLRPLFKHAEWHYFLVVMAIAIGVVVVR